MTEDRSGGIKSKDYSDGWLLSKRDSDLLCMCKLSFRFHCTYSRHCAEFRGVSAATEVGFCIVPECPPIDNGVTDKTSRTSLSNVFKVKVKIIETSMSMYAMHVYRHVQFECHSLHIVPRYCIDLSTS